jgi:hypothetical protein
VRPGCLLLLLLSGGCDEGGPPAGDGGPDGALEQGPAFVIRPRVFVWGRVKEAKLVQVARVDLDAQRLVPVRHEGCEATDESGGCELTLYGRAGDYLLEFAGGLEDRFIPKSMQDLVETPWHRTNARMRALVLLEESERGSRPVVVVSPLTDQGAARLLYMLEQGRALGDENASINRVMELDVTRQVPDMPEHLTEPSPGLRHAMAMVSLSLMADRGEVASERLIAALFDDIHADGVQDGRDAVGPVRVGLIELGPRTMKSRLLLRLRWLIHAWNTGDTLETSDLWPWIERAYALSTDVYAADETPTCPDPEIIIEVPSEENPGFKLGGDYLYFGIRATVKSPDAVVVWQCTSYGGHPITKELFQSSCDGPFDVEEVLYLGSWTFSKSHGNGGYGDVLVKGQSHGAVWIKTDCGSEAIAISNVSFAP